MSDTTVETRVLAESEAIERWRFSQLLAAGYSDERASLLSTRTDIDLHLATDLLANGCSPETVFRILV